jgi:hypothetical protein
MVLEEVVELAARGEEAKITAKGVLVERACHSPPLIPQLCLQSEVAVMGAMCQVQVLLMAQGLEAQAAPTVPMGLTTEAMGAEEHITMATAVLVAQASSSFATSQPIAPPGR